MHDETMMEGDQGAQHISTCISLAEGRPHMNNAAPSKTTGVHSRLMAG